MADKIPVKAIYTGTDVTSLGEYTSTDTIASTYLSTGTGATDVATGDHTHSGYQSATADYDVGDNVTIKLGTHDDLQIYHDGNDSYIREGGNGLLFIRGSTGVRIQGTNGENGITLNENASVDLYYDNAKKFETTSTGVDVTGATVTDQLTVQGGITEQETTKTASFTPNLSTDGTIFDCSGTMTITMPSATAGKSFTIIDSGSGTVSWGGTIKWSGGTAPTPSGITIISFISNGTDWYGMQAGTGFA